jgi:hypothetical protein
VQGQWTIVTRDEAQRFDVGSPAKPGQTLVSGSRSLTASALPLAGSWADAFATRAATHAGAETRFADRLLARADEGLKLFAASRSDN